MLGRMIPLALLATTLTAMGCSVKPKSANGNNDVKIETPFGGLKVQTNDSAVLEDIGLSVYPGSTVVKQHNDNGAADVDMHFGDYRLRVKAVSYRTPDPTEKVETYYRKELGRFGDVIECSGSRAVSTPARTRQGLTCDNDKKGRVTIRDVGEHADIELKAGGKLHQHIVAVEREAAGTKYGLIALDLPSGKKESD